MSNDKQLNKKDKQLENFLSKNNDFLIMISTPEIMIKTLFIILVGD